MGAVLTLMETFLDTFYTPFLGALEMVPIFNAEILFGVGYFSLAEIIAGSFVVFLFGFIVYIPFALIGKFIKR